MRDGQTLIARENGRRRMTVRCDIVGRDQGGFVREAQEHLRPRDQPSRRLSRRVAGDVREPRPGLQALHGPHPHDHRADLSRARRGLRSFRAALILLLPIPFAFASGAVALYLRHMHLNVSTGVGFAALFGIAIMDGILMFKGVSKHRLEGASVDEAIIRGRTDRLRSGLMTSLVPILGLLPAALATSLGSDVQRPLATVITCGLSGSALFTLVYYAGLLSHLRAPASRIAVCPRSIAPGTRRALARRHPP